MKIVTKRENIAKKQVALDFHNVEQDIRDRLRRIILEVLDREQVAILPPLGVEVSLELVHSLQIHFDTVMLDPWYNKGFGGVQEDYVGFFLEVIRQSGEVADHVYFWGFPEIVAPFVERIPPPFASDLLAHLVLQEQSLSYTRMAV